MSQSKRLVVNISCNVLEPRLLPSCSFQFRNITSVYLVLSIPCDVLELERSELAQENAPKNRRLTSFYRHFEHFTK